MKYIPALMIFAILPFAVLGAQQASLLTMTIACAPNIGTLAYNGNLDCTGFMNSVIPSYASTSGNTLLYVTASVAGATVSIDGGPQLTTPTTGLTIKAGVHTITVSAPAYNTVSITKYFYALPSNSVNALLSRSYSVEGNMGKLLVTANTNNALVYVKGLADSAYRFVTTTGNAGAPSELLLDAGMYQITMKKSGFHDFAGSAIVTAGQQAPLSGMLAMIPVVPNPFDTGIPVDNVGGPVIPTDLNIRDVITGPTDLTNGITSPLGGGFNIINIGTNPLTNGGATLIGGIGGLINTQLNPQLPTGPAQANVGIF